MPKFNVKNISAIKNLIYGTMDKLDPSGANSGVYKSLFSKMSTPQLIAWFDKFFESEDQNFYLEFIPMEREVTVVEIQKAADFLGVPLYEYVYLPSECGGNMENPAGTMFPVPVGYIHVRRVQQMVFKKSSMSTEIDVRDQRTGQVANYDKNGRSSDVENASLLVMGANNTAREHMGPRADDMVMKTELYSNIKNFGYGEYGSLTSSVFNKTALNTTDVLFVGAGFKTNLVTDDLELPRTAQMKRDVDTSSSKYK
ncbi:MAG: hypothetical protein ACRC0G_07325 [Fusobacteriaceae bacterium]